MIRRVSFGHLWPKGEALQYEIAHAVYGIAVQIHDSFNIFFAVHGKPPPVVFGACKRTLTSYKRLRN